MENLISIFVKKLSNCSLEDAQILLDQTTIIRWEKLKEIKSSILSNPNLKNNDIIHLYYSRFLQTLFAEESPTAEAYIHGIILFCDLKNCIKDYNFENPIKILLQKIGKTIKESSNLESILRLVNEIKKIKSEFSVGEFIDIENDIYLGLKAWIVEKFEESDILLLRECYKSIDYISTDSLIKQKIDDLVAVKVYNWFQKKHRRLILDNLCNNILSALDDETRKIYNWITRIDCRQDINIKIANFEPLIRNVDTYESEPKSIYRVTERNQLADENKDGEYLASSKKKSYHLAVYKQKIIHTGDIVVVKSFITDKRENLQNGLNEKEIYEKLSMKNIDITLKYYGFFETEKHKNSEDKYKLNLVLEYCESTLYDEMTKLHKANQAYQNQEIAKNTYTLLGLFKRLRIEKVNHCDIKPQNIFIASERRFKIGDFDLSETFNTNQASNLGTKLHEFQGGTVDYMAPELKDLYILWQTNGNPCDKRKISKERSDVFSLGLVFLMMITLKSVEGLNEQNRRGELIQRIENLELDWVKRLLRKMLANNYHDRPRFSQALEMLEDDPEFILCINSPG